MAKKAVKIKVKTTKPKKAIKKRPVKSAKKPVKKMKKAISQKLKKAIPKKSKKSPTKKVAKTPRKITPKSIPIPTIINIAKNNIVKSGKNDNKKNKNIEAILLEERAKVVYELTRLEEISLDKSQREASGDLSGYSIHLADVASDSEEIEKVLKLRSYFEGKVKWIDDALLKVKNGAFGVCEECGEFIGVERLRARPEAKHCIKCRAKLEATGHY